MSEGVEGVRGVGDQGAIGAIHQILYDKYGRQLLGVLGKNCVPPDFSH